MVYKPIDIETELKFSVQTYAIPLPNDFVVPCALITRTGGDITSKVLNTHSISVDVYAETWSESSELANRLVGELVARENTACGDVTITLVECSLPYINKDPKHESIPRTTFTARLTCRSI